MIAFLRGRLLDADPGDPGTVAVDVGGVGYLVYCSSRTAGALPAAGEPAELFVETHVREDHIHLYGFASRAERAWFRLLLKVQGVGARMALGVLSALAPEDLTATIATQDRAALRRVPGIGPKVAARILAELRDKEVEATSVAAPRRLDHSGDAIAAEAVSALVNLGYGRGEAHAAVARAGSGDLAGRIRRGLKELSAP